jgi:hypothetical protein
VYKENRAVFPFCRKFWWQSSKTFQKVNYVTCSLVLWKYTFGVICTKMLQIQRKICFKVRVNNFFFFYRSLKNLRSDKDVEMYLLKSQSDDNEKMSCYRQFIRGFNFYKEDYIGPGELLPSLGVCHL